MVRWRPLIFVGIYLACVAAFVSIVVFVRWLGGMDDTYIELRGLLFPIFIVVDIVLPGETVTEWWRCADILPFFCMAAIYAPMLFLPLVIYGFTGKNPWKLIQIGLLAIALFWFLAWESARIILPIIFYIMEAAIKAHIIQ